MKLKYIILVVLCTSIMTGCGAGDDKESLISDDTGASQSLGISEQLDETAREDDVKKTDLVDEKGGTLETRIKVPDGYRRTDALQDSFTMFVRNYPLKEAGSQVLLYNGEPKGAQGDHVAVMKLPIENYDLQQCADSIMRMYAEYYYQLRQYSKIHFLFVSGFEARFDKWMQGYGISISGNDVSYVRDSSCDGSYESFKKFMRMVFNYASTLSMVNESKEILPQDIEVGDVFLYGGSPGHVVMVADVCVDSQGKKAFLLAQGFMPAQEFHILKNDNSEDGIWYYAEDISYPFHTPQYTFESGSLRRLNY